MDWRLKPGVTIHYVTSEIVEITDDGTTLVIKTEQKDFYAELTLAGYQCENGMSLQSATDRQKIRFHGQDGAMVLSHI